MSVGHMVLRVLLDEPKKVYYGNEESITGSVAVAFQPSSKYAGGELFGPLRLTMTLHGRCKTKLWKKSGAGQNRHTHIYRGRVELFSIDTIIFDDQFRSRPGQTQHIAFAIDFPTTARPGFDAGWEANGRYIPEEPLPPSFREESRGFGHHYESFIEYRVGVSALMPNIKIDITSHGKYDEPVVRYERPRIPPPVNAPLVEAKNTISVSNELLLPPAERPAGFKQKMKVAFTSNNYPNYTFLWKCTGPQHIHLHERIKFKISIKPLLEHCTATLVPQVYLTHFQFEVRAITLVRGDKGLFNYPEYDSNNSLATTGRAFPVKVPFTEANDWTQTVSIGKLNEFPSQFSTPIIVRAYNMKIKVGFEVAGVRKEFTNLFPLTMLPPIQGTRVPGTRRSRDASLTQTVTEDMILPRYEPPPTYESEVGAE